MDVVTSTQNKFVKLARSLSQRKFRAETGLFLAEGVNLLRDMPRGVMPVFVLAATDRYDEARDMFADRCADIFAVSEAVIRSVADTESPYGIAAVCKIPDTDFAMPQGKALLLDGVSDPGNLGTILRTAAACDFCDVYLLDTADVFSPKVIRASLGSLFRLRLHATDESLATELVQSTDSVALDMGGENILKSRLDGNVLFVAGNEAHGIRKCLINAAKRVCSLPMKNQIESLNVAVASAVAMYRTV